MGGPKITQHGYRSLIGGGPAACPECNTNQVRIGELKQIKGCLYGAFVCDSCYCQFELKRVLDEADPLRDEEFLRIF